MNITRWAVRDATEASPLLGALAFISICLWLPEPSTALRISARREMLFKISY